MNWEAYQGRACLTFYDKDGKGFTGGMDDFEKTHGHTKVYKNRESGEIILISENCQIVATGRVINEVR